MDLLLHFVIEVHIVVNIKSIVLQKASSTGGFGFDMTSESKQFFPMFPSFSRVVFGDVNVGPLDQGALSQNILLVLEEVKRDQNRLDPTK